MPEVEIERYELREAPSYRFVPDRRDFLQVLGGGILLFLALDASAQESGSAGRRGRSAHELPANLGAWLHIGEDGVVTVYTGKAEVGQNIRTSLTQAVAEELRMQPGSIRLVMADTDLTPWDMGTFGSRTTPTMAPELHRVAATARDVLVDRAAEIWKADRASLTLHNGSVSNAANGSSLSFGELAKGQNLTATISPDAPAKAAAGWEIAGHDLAKIAARDIVTGKHRYAADVTRPGMLHARIVRPPAFRSTLASIDTSAAGRIDGVTVVHEGDFVGVAAPDRTKLAQAVSGIQVEWKSPDQINARELFSYLKAKPAAQDGATTEALRAADVKAESAYTIAYIAHTPLEPRAAVAEWNGGRLTVWTGSQVPFGVRSELAQAFGIPEERVRVIVPDTGSAYGGKHTGEAAVEAARLAKAAKKPVKLIWTREEEFTWAYFRPAGVIDIRSGARKDGTITAWEIHNYNSGPSGIRSRYDIPNEKAEFHEVDAPLRQGSYRGLAATANHFARESHMDELAHAAGIEPLAFRLKNTTDPRLRAAMEAAAERFGWGQAKSRAGQGFGMSAGFEKGGYVACCAEVTVAPGTGHLKIERVVEAFECGAVVNPEHLKNQIEGAVAMGIGGALFEAIDFDNGRILNPRLSQYRVPRFNDMPFVESVVIDRKDLPSAGSGETPIVGIAPALANAIFDACGQRKRSMPMKFA